jgi:hypothetical protein
MDNHHNPPFGLTRAVSYLGLLLCSLGLRNIQAAPEPVPGPSGYAPPPAPPIQQWPQSSGSSGSHPKPLGVTPYSIGQPTDEEQLYLEYLNRMRAGSTAEGQRLANTTDPNVLSEYAGFMVDLGLMQAEFATNPPAAPLAMNSQLMAAARWHSGDMFTNQYQGHFQTNGSTVLNPGDRIAAIGYKASTWGENVFSHAESVFYGHAGFAVDWGPGGQGGMQSPPGHRNNMLSPLFREVGMGVVDGMNGSVGPQLITQDLATQTASPAFITGVVYFDLNGNHFYDPGEGIGGVTVNTPGSTYFAVTADSGGYAIPVSANGSYSLTFSAAGLTNQTTITISNLQNEKVDFTPNYAPPTISGPNPAALNQNNLYSFTTVPAATSYQWEQAQLIPYTDVEGAENGLGNVTVISSPGYSVDTTDMAASGTHSFNLVHTDPANQSITLNASLLVNASSALSFARFLGFALSNEVAQAEVSADGGQNWQTVWSESGNDGSSSVDSNFMTETIPLNAYAGQIVQVRFVFAFNGGFFFNTPGSGVGLYLDNISVSNASQVSGAVTNMIASGNSFTFVPTSSTNYLLGVRAQINSRLLPWGPVSIVSTAAAIPTPAIEFASAPIVSGSQIQIVFTVANYSAGVTFELIKTSNLQGAWTRDTSATLQTLVPNSKFRFTTSAEGSTNAFFKIKAS